jgi:dGTPase
MNVADDLRDSLRSLTHLATPSTGEWTVREHGSGGDGDPRDPFERDRDRILHSESFRRLQHKTQVFIVTESDLFSTRILHSMEAAQLGRSLASMLGLNQALAEAICLGHDVGHAPFGHVGEATLAALLEGAAEWNANVHSLMVLDELEVQYPDFLGLDLTWATREGIARHRTPFDAPAEFGGYAQSSLEAQVANLVDEIAYITHDVHDALRYRVISSTDLDKLRTKLWDEQWRRTLDEYDQYHPGGWTGVDADSVRFRRVHRHLIYALLHDAIVQSAANASDVPDLFGRGRCCA